MDKLDVKKLLLQYGHIAALAVAASLVLATIVMGSDNKLGAELEKVERWSKDIDYKIRTAPPNIPREKLPEYTEELRGYWQRLGDNRSVTETDPNYWRTLRDSLDRIDAKGWQKTLNEIKANSASNWQKIQAFVEKKDDASKERLRAPLTADPNSFPRNTWKAVIQDIMDNETSVLVNDFARLIDEWSRRNTVVQNMAFQEDGVEKTPLDIEQVKAVLDQNSQLGNRSTAEIVYKELERKDVRVGLEIIDEVLAKGLALRTQLDVWKEKVFAVPGPGRRYLYETASLIPQRKAAPTQLYMSDPGEIQVTVQPDIPMYVLLQWEAPPQNLGNKAPAVIAGYFVFKEWEDRGESYKQIFELRERQHTSFQDNEVDTEIKYLYRVCAYTENKDAQEGTKLAAESPAMLPKLRLSQGTQQKLEKIEKTVEEWLPMLVRSRFTDTVDAFIASPYRIELRGISEKKAMVKLYKKERGQEYCLDCMFNEGDTIQGSMRAESNDIEFNPKWKLAEVHQRYKVITYTPREIMVREPKKLFEINADFKNDLKKNELSRNFERAFKNAGFPLSGQVEISQREGKWWGKDTTDHERPCIVFLGLKVKTSGISWFLDDTRSNKQYIAVDEQEKLGIYDPSQGNFEKDKSNSFIRPRILIPSEREVPAIIYLDTRRGDRAVVYRR